MSPYGLQLAILLLGLPLTLYLMRRSLGVLILSVAAAYVCIGLYLHLTAHLTSIAPPDGSAFHDTYYVVARGDYFLWVGIIICIVGALTLFVSRVGRLAYPKTTTALFWVWHIGMVVNLALLSWFYQTFQMPRRYMDYEESFQTLNLISNWSAVVFLCAGALFLALLGWSCATSLAAYKRK